VGPIRLGVPRHISARPLIYGLMRGANPRFQIRYDEPSCLADDLARRRLDAALIPSIEYLRGSGHLYLEGPAQVATAKPGNLLFVARKPIPAIERVAVCEYSRTPVALLRIVLGEQFGATPDLLVEKNPRDWRERYDAMLVSSDAALQFRLAVPEKGDTIHNVAQMWYGLTDVPLVTALWVYSNPSLAAELTKTLVASRNLGMQNLSRLADGIAHTSQYDAEFLYEYLSGCWSYDMREPELLGLRALEEHALKYDLLRQARMEPIGTG
jgi:predicted solute-binding protein